MILTTIILFLLTLPFLIKLGILYIAYVEWALSMPVPFSVTLFKQHIPKPKKVPIGFSISTVGDVIAPVINKIEKKK